MNMEAVFLSKSLLAGCQIIQYYNSDGYNMNGEVIDQLSHCKLLTGDLVPWE